MSSASQGNIYLQSLFNHVIFLFLGKKKRILAASHSLTHKASTTLSHCAFLCTVLSEVTEYHSLAFKVGMFGIEMTRLPASTKPMEVKSNYHYDLFYFVLIVYIH